MTTSIPGSNSFCKGEQLEESIFNFAFFIPDGEVVRKPVYNLSCRFWGIHFMM